MIKSLKAIFLSLFILGALSLLMETTSLSPKNLSIESLSLSTDFSCKASPKTTDETLKTDSCVSDKNPVYKQWFSLQTPSLLLRWIISLMFLSFWALATNILPILEVKVFFSRCIIKSAHYFLRLNVLTSQAHPPTQNLISII